FTTAVRESRVERRYENRENAEAVSGGPWATLPPQGSRPGGHARTGLGAEAAGERIVGERRSGIEPPAGRPRGPGPLGAAGDSSGHGRGRERRNHQAHHVGRESAGRASVVV